MKPLPVVFAMLVAFFVARGTAWGQKDTEEPPAALVSFLVIKDSNGKPVRNASVIMHAVSKKGQQEKGDLELKTDPDGKTSFDGIPYGMLRVQVLAQGFQTYGQDFDVEKRNVEITIKLKRPQQQYSIYDDRPKEPNPPPKPESPPGTTDQKPD
jgi:Carboxypeptidase regulatory-like domain